MSVGTLIHDDFCDRVYVYVDGFLALDWHRSDTSWREMVADALEGVDVAAEYEGVLAACGPAPHRMADWPALRPCCRDGDGSLTGIARFFALSLRPLALPAEEPAGA